jgi:hypothetical protein
MKNVWLVILGVAAAFSASAQVFSASQEIEKGVNRDGMYISSAVREKFVKESWKARLAAFGRVDERRDTYTVTGANIAALSADPVTLTSKISSKGGRTTVFMAINLGNEEYITANHSKYGAAEKILNDFAEKLTLEEGVRAAEKELKDSEEKRSDVTNLGEKLVRRIEDNAKEKERLQRKLQENADDLIKFKQDQEKNKVDQSRMAEEVELKRKAVENAKGRLASAGSGN